MSGKDIWGGGKRRVLKGGQAQRLDRPSFIDDLEVGTALADVR